MERNNNFFGGEITTLINPQVIRDACGTLHGVWHMTRLLHPKQHSKHLKKHKKQKIVEKYVS